MASSSIAGSLSRLPALLFLGVGLGGCALAPADDEAQASAAVEARATEVREGRMTSKEFGQLVDFVQLSQCSVSVVDGVGAAVPSPMITMFLYPKEDPPNPAAHAIRFEIPPVEYNVGPAHYEVEISELKSELFEMSLEDSWIRGRVKLSGRIHVHHWLLPDADLVIDAADATIKILRQNGQTSFGGLTLDITNHVENCGWFSWCDSFVESALPKVNEKARQILEQKAREALALEVTQTATVTAVQKLEDLMGGYTPPYLVEPPTIRIENRAIRYRASRTVP